MKDTTNVATRNPLKGKIVSVSKDLTTIKVSIERIVADKMYGKRMHLNTYIFADAKGHSNLAVGNSIEILPCKKISKMKSWKVVATHS